MTTSVGSVVANFVAHVGGGVEWGAAVMAFLDHLRADNCTVATIDTYRTFLDGGRARRWREAHNIARAHQLDADALQAMKAEFLADGLRPATVDDYVRMHRTFARFCIERGWGVDAKTLMVHGPRQEKRVPPTFTAEEEARLIAACRIPRDRILVQLILETGLRRSEVARLTVDDIIETGDGSFLRVHQGKGRKDRGVPISDDFAVDLERFVKTRPSTRCRLLFLTSNRKEGGDYRGLSSNGIYRVWNRLGKETGIRAWPHKGRHTAATRWATDRMSPFGIQKALGHGSIRMAMRYVDSSAVDLMEEFRNSTFKRRRVAR